MKIGNRLKSLGQDSEPDPRPYLDNARFEGKVYSPSGSGLTLDFKMKMLSTILTSLLLVMFGCRTHETPKPYRIHMFNGIHLAEHPAQEADLILSRTIFLHHPFDIDITGTGGQVFAKGILTENESGSLHFEGTAGHSGRSGHLNQDIVPGEYFSPKLITFSGGIIISFTLTIEEI